MSRTRYPLPLVPQPENVRYVCVPVPDEQFHIGAFLGAIFNLSKWYSWRADDDHTGKLAADMWLPIYRSVAAALEENDGCGAGGIMLLRQNPDDSCQLEFSNDAGETWSLAFDYGLCTPGWAAPIVASTNENSPPSPFQPENTWIYSTGETTTEVEYRQQALCEAARVMVNAAMDFFVKAKQEELQIQAAAAIALGILTLIAPVIGAGLWMAFGTGVAFAALSVIAIHSAAITLETANDPDIRQYFVCHLITALRGRPVTLADFQAAFSDADVCTEEPYTSVAHYLYDLFSTSQYSENMYNNFLRSLGDTTLTVRAGETIDSCGCDDGAWCHDFYGAELRDRFLNENPAKTLWNSTYNGWYSNGTAGNSFVQISLAFFVPTDTTITGITMYYDRPSGGSNVVTVSDSDGNATQSTTAPPPYQWSIYQAGGYSKTGKFMKWNFDQFRGGAVTTIGITRVRITGTGQRLFGSCDNCV